MPVHNINTFLGAAVLGIIGAAGMFIFERYRQQKVQHTMARDLARLDNELIKIKQELDLMRKKNEKWAKLNQCLLKVYLVELF